MFIFIFLSPQGIDYAENTRRVGYQINSTALIIGGIIKPYSFALDVFQASAIISIDAIKKIAASIFI